jgi:hypothetical protein
MLDGVRCFVGKRVVFVGLAVLLCALVLYSTWGRSGGPVVGDLSPVSLDTLGTYRVGEFIVSLEDESGGAVLKLAHNSRPRHSLWQSVSGESFVSAARGRESVRSSRAHFHVEDALEERLTDQSVENVEKRGTP